MARRQSKCSRNSSPDDFRGISTDNCANLDRPDPAYFSGHENGPTQSRFVFPTSLIGISILIGFAIMCSYDRWALVNQFDIVKTEVIQMKKELITIKEMLQKFTPLIATSERQMKEVIEMKNCFSNLFKSTNALREDTKKDIAEKTLVMTNILTDALKPLNEIIENGGFTADGTGKVDFALESTGGKVVNTRHTETYASNRAHSFFGFPLCKKGNPQAIIQPGVLPGQCWAFKGANGSAVIQLIGYIYVTSVTMEHIPVILSPSGSISSAPRDFSIWGLKSEDDVEGFFFGQFVYDKNGPPKQTFQVQHKSKLPHPYIELKILSNHGEQRYTCVYRLRVHGELVSFKTLKTVI